MASNDFESHMQADNGTGVLECQAMVPLVERRFAFFTVFQVVDGKGNVLASLIKGVAASASKDFSFTRQLGRSLCGGGFLSQYHQLTIVLACSRKGGLGPSWKERQAPPQAA